MLYPIFVNPVPLPYIHCFLSIVKASILFVKILIVSNYGLKIAVVPLKDIFGDAVDVYRGFDEIAVLVFTDVPCLDTII